MKRPLVLEAPKDTVYGTPASRVKIAAAYGKAMDEYQELIGDKWPHEQALMTAEAILIGTLTGLYNVLAEEQDNG